MIFVVVGEKLLANVVNYLIWHYFHFMQRWSLHNGCLSLFFFTYTLPHLHALFLFQLCACQH